MACLGCQKAPAVREQVREGRGPKELDKEIGRFERAKGASKLVGARQSESNIGRITCEAAGLGLSLETFRVSHVTGHAGSQVHGIQGVPSLQQRTYFLVDCAKLYTNRAH